MEDHLEGGHGGEDGGKEEKMGLERGRGLNCLRSHSVTGQPSENFLCGLSSVKHLLRAGAMPRILCLSSDSWKQPMWKRIHA
jgi:hypothetical protein